MYRRLQLCNLAIVWVRRWFGLYTIGTMTYLFVVFCPVRAFNSARLIQKSCCISTVYSDSAITRARSVSGLYVDTHRYTPLDFIPEKRHGACRNPATASANGLGRLGLRPRCAAPRTGGGPNGPHLR